MMRLANLRQINLRPNKMPVELKASRKRTGSARRRISCRYGFFPMDTGMS